ncbi:MAG: alpha/beta fold hydrolase [Planctomycetia bacterium]|nr:alpha/beta fold hydrolase [Planctomycetia bacterium]
MNSLITNKEFYINIIMISTLVFGCFVKQGQSQENNNIPEIELNERMNLLEYRDSEITQTISTVSDWNSRKSQILKNIELVMGTCPGNERRSELDPELLEEKVFEDYIQQKWGLTPEPNDRIFVWLLIPEVHKDRCPAMLCLHPTHEMGKDVPVGFAGNSHRFYAKELCKRGYVCLSPDYGPYGENSFDPYSAGYQSATMKGVWNHIRCLDFLQSLDFVDGEKLGVIGHSLGGHNALFLAVFDERVKAVVTSCGFTTMYKYMQGNLAGWSQDKYMPRIKSVYKDNPLLVPFDFNEILAIIAPRPIFINAPVNDDNFDLSGVQDSVQSALRIYQLYGAADKITLMQPDAEHDFPDNERFMSYQFLDEIFFSE